MTEDSPSSTVAGTQQIPAVSGVSASPDAWTEQDHRDELAEMVGPDLVIPKDFPAELLTELLDWVSDGNYPLDLAEALEAQGVKLGRLDIDEFTALTHAIGGMVVDGSADPVDTEWRVWWDGLTPEARDAWLRDPDSFTILTPTEPTGSSREATVTETVSHVRPLAAYFDLTGNGQTVFVPPRLAQDIADDLHITRGPGGGLWYDAGGVYRSGAEDLVADIVRRVLEDKYRANRLNEVMSWMKTLPVDISTDPPSENIINVANGVLDLDTLTLRAVRDDERFTYQIPVRWNPSADCPAIEAFVREVVPADTVGLVAEIIGMCLLPTSRYRRAVMLLGPGSNGKSVLLRVVKTLLGVENISSVTLQALSEDKFAKAQLFGKLANVAGDLDSKPVERSGAFKMLTGEDTVTAEHKFGQPFQFVSGATLVFSANEWPVSHDQTDAYFTRWIAIPFDQRYREDGDELKPGERRADPKLGDKLLTTDELEGLLVRAVMGARRLQERGGFAIPASVRGAVEDYRQWADTVIAWTDECVTTALDRRMPRRDVYRFYQEWCKDNGRAAVSSKKFWPRFRTVLKESTGYELEEVKSDGVWTTTGLAITP